MAAIKIAVVGMGKIARDQHLPSIAGNADFEFVASVSPRDPGVDGVANFKSLESLLADGPAIASMALAKRVHVFLEKPPGATLAEVDALEAQAAETGTTLFAGWHSRFAAGVAPAKAWLADRQIQRVSIVWREDVRVWHPGQAWIWEPGGLGVFDPGINALSIATEILPQPFFLTAATLSTPANRAAPIAADLTFRSAAGTPITMDLDWRQTGPQSWDITVETDAGTLSLAKGGAVLTLPSGTVHNYDEEYPGLYTRFAALIRGGQSEVDTTPFTLVADAFLRGTRKSVEAFDD